MNSWKEGLLTATIGILGEKLLGHSKHFPEEFLTILASTLIAKYIMNLEYKDNRPMFGPQNFIGPAEDPAKKIKPPNRV